MSNVLEVRSKKYVVFRRFKGIPTSSDFFVNYHDLTSLKEGQILVKVEWASVDPYLYTYNSIRSFPYDQFGYTIGVILDSKNSSWKTGTRIIGHQGWCDYYILDAHDPDKTIGMDTVDYGVYKLPDLQDLPRSLALGVIGIPGLKAYFGILEICKPREGETVVVTEPGGSVGSIAGQIAKMQGCTVIGLTNSDKKVNWLKKDLGFDHALNYKSNELSSDLKKAAPQGIDCFFDDVGGELNYTVLEQMNEMGRVAVSGCISIKDEFPNLKKELHSQHLRIMAREHTVKGFQVYQFIEKWPKAFDDLKKWIKNGDLKATEHVVEGFENCVDVFGNMMKGETLGKALVHIW